MSASQVVKIRNGESLGIRVGVLRGAGPQGPPGPATPGPPGPPGPKGDPGVVSDVFFRLADASSTTVSIAGWTQLSLLTTADTTGLTTPRDNFTFTAKDSGRYLVTVAVTFLKPTSGNASGARQVRLVDTAPTPNVLATISLPAVPADDTVVIVSEIVTLDASKLYRIEGKSRDAVAVQVTTRSLSCSRVGAGPAGPQGPLGPPGQQGSVGPEGPPGQASSGFTTFDGVSGGSSATNPGGVTLVTPDQGMPIPATNQKPAIPYFLNLLAFFLEKRVMARFTSATDRNTRRPTRSHGEMYTLTDVGVPYFVEKNGTERAMARVIYSTSLPPTGAGQAQPGLLWAQY